MISKKISEDKYLRICPWHYEKTPSLLVNTKTQTFNCFGCGKKGTITELSDREREPWAEELSANR